MNPPVRSARSSLNPSEVQGYANWVSDKSTVPKQAANLSRMRFKLIQDKSSHNGIGFERNLRPFFCSSARVLVIGYDEQLVLESYVKI